MKESLRRLILSALTPVQKWAQKIGNPEPRISEKFVNDLKAKIQDGDILLSREEWRLTNPFVPGFFGHSAMYRDGRVIEAVGEGVRSECYYRWMYSKDHVAALRPPLSQAVRYIASTIARDQIGAPYDYQFEDDPKAFFCSELTRYAYRIATDGKFDPSTMTPQDQYDACKNAKTFDLILEEINT
jgi:uncharacterized protein YycO